MILHSLKTDWRHLWPLFVIAWLAMIASAVPLWGFRLDHVSLLPDLPFARDFMQDRPSHLHAWILLLSGPLLHAAGAAIGFSGSSWTRTRPLRKGELLAGKVAAIVLFLVIPQALVQAAVTIRLGFDVPVAAAHVARCAVAALLWHLVSMGFGKLCGGFWKWLGAAAALHVLSALSMVLGMLSYHLGQLSGIARGWVTGSPMSTRLEQWWPLTCMLLLLAAGLACFRGRHPALRISVGIVAILTAPFLSQWTRPPFPGPAVLRLPDMEEIPTLELETKSLGNPSDAYLKLRPLKLPPGVGVAWTLEKGYPLYGPGGEIPHLASQDRPMGRGSFLRNETFLRPNDMELPLPEGVPQPDDYLCGDTNLIYLNRFGEAAATAAGDRIAVRAQVLGVAGRYELVAELSPAEATEIRTPISRTWMRFTANPHPRLELRRLDLSGAQSRFESEAEQSLLPIVHLPAENRSILIRSISASAPYALSGELQENYQSYRDTSRDRVFRHEERTANKLPPWDTRGARLYLVRTKILGKIRTTVEADGLRFESRADHSQFHLVFGAAPGPANDSTNCNVPMPDPATCSLEEASQWFNHVLLHHERDDGAIRGMEPFVHRFPELLIQQRGQNHYRGSIHDRLIRMIPPEGKRMCIDSALKPGGDFMLPMIVSRGWLPEARTGLLERFGREESPSSDLAKTVCHFEEPATYPKLLETLRRSADASFYHALRLLPGIAPDLDASMVEMLKPEEEGNTYEARQRLILPALHGMREGFNGAWKLCATAPPQDAPWTWQFLWRVTSVPEEYHNDLAAFFTKHRPEEFEYDPLSFSWRLKSPSAPR